MSVREIEETAAASAASLKAQILALVAQYYESAHKAPPFVPGQTRIRYSGRVYGAEEIVNAVDSALDFWLTLGPYGNRFEVQMRRFFGARDFTVVNSGSAANLLMVATLCSPELDRVNGRVGKDRLRPGDEIITPAVTFPTTLAPIVQNGLVPVFVDCEVGTYNINPALVEDAIGPKTKAIFVPHTLGFPCDMNVIAEIARRRRLWLLEDGCDSLGATFCGRLAGTFGEMSSISFYPAHHITMGEGGGVVINHPWLIDTARSIRDWGRHCWCDPGKSNTCGKRFGWHLGELPEGYDHKYVYSNIGYNLKPTDLQAAIGVAQFERLGDFIERRRHNFRRLYDGLKPLEDYLILPRLDPRANPSPFGFAVTVRDGMERCRLVEHLEGANIETRLVFGGSILRQPGYLHIERRISGELSESDRIMTGTLFVGVYPGLTDSMIDYMIEQFAGFFLAPRTAS